jgi:hypothetical protein
MGALTCARSLTEGRDDELLQVDVNTLKRPEYAAKLRRCLMARSGHVLIRHCFAYEIQL